MDKGKSLTNMSLAAKREAPPLLDLCVSVAIRNLRYMGDVGDTASDLLERILPHCTLDQLMHIQKSTKGRDLTLITDKLWRQFYEETFGVERAEIVAEKMKVAKVNFAWMDLYESSKDECCSHEKYVASKKSRCIESVDHWGPSRSAGRNYNTSNSKFNKPLERKF